MSVNSTTYTFIMLALRDFERNEVWSIHYKVKTIKKNKFDIDSFCKSIVVPDEIAKITGYPNGFTIPKQRFFGNNNTNQFKNKTVTEPLDNKITSKPLDNNDNITNNDTNGNTNGDTNGDTSGNTEYFGTYFIESNRGQQNSSENGPLKLMRSHHLLFMDLNT